MHSISNVCISAEGAALFVTGSSFGDDNTGAVFTCRLSSDHRYVYL